MFELKFQNLKGASRALVSRIDAERSNTLAAYKRMGRPRYPTVEQVRKLNQESQLSPPESLTIERGELRLILPPERVRAHRVRQVSASRGGGRTKPAPYLPSSLGHTPQN